MTCPPLLWLILIFVVTSAISVVTGSTSLITVPAMLQFHIEPRTALATNMFALTFMSVGGAFPFLRGQAVDRGRLPLLTALTLAGSVIGAFLLLLIPTHSVPIIVSAAMIGVAIFSLVQLNDPNSSSFVALLLKKFCWRVTRLFIDCHWFLYWDVSPIGTVISFPASM
jgi:uncharacterized membrane protein YfcA